MKEIAPVFPLSFFSPLWECLRIPTLDFLPHFEEVHSVLITQKWVHSPSVGWMKWWVVNLSFQIIPENQARANREKTASWQKDNKKNTEQGSVFLHLNKPLVENCKYHLCCTNASLSPLSSRNVTMWEACVFLYFYHRTMIWWQSTDIWV